MTDSTSLYSQAVMLDAERHRYLKMAELTDYSIARHMHAAYVASSEFPQAALEFPIVFIKSGEPDASGRSPVSPIALLGLTQGENLHVDGSRWDARYIPAVVRRYPFLTVKREGTDVPGLLIDAAWSGFSETDGEALFESEGKASPALMGAIKFVELFDAEARQTRDFCTSLQKLDILREMTADARLPDGTSFSVNGFYTVDEDKLRALPDASVLGLHRSGMLILLQIHLLSLNNLRHLVDRKARRLQAAASPA